MRGTIQGSRARRLAAAAVAAASIAAVGCGPFGVALREAKDLIAGGARDVAFAVVDSDGHVYPKTLIVAQNIHSIVWLADADVLQINPGTAPLTVDCAGPICKARMPASTLGQFEYTGNVTVGKTTKDLDPHLEVVPAH